MSVKVIICAASSALLLAACSSSRVASGLDSSPQQVNVATNNPLALPPDLSLKQPGAAPGYAPAQPAAPLNSGTAKAAPLAPATAPQQDVYAQYGVSKTNPDGTPKTEEALQKELRAAILKRKQQQNPGYGTIWNMGSIFSDG